VRGRGVDDDGRVGVGVQEVVEEGKPSSPSNPSVLRFVRGRVGGDVSKVGTLLPTCAVGRRGW